MLIPLITAQYYHEDIMPFVIAILFALLLGASLILPSRLHTEYFSIQDGFSIVSFSWIIMSIIGSLPFYISGEIRSYVDAFFETISGFTTTGASILPDVTALGKGLLMWRSLTHWIGGMGVFVLMLALLWKNPSRSINIIKAEMPGVNPSKLSPKLRTTARFLYLLYISLTVSEILLLYISGMPLYDSVVHSLGTAGTGGFGILRDSIASYSSASQYIIAIYMLIFATNFGIYYLIITGKWRNALKSSEFKLFISIVILAVLIISAVNRSLYKSGEELIRSSLFQVASVISTTGYSTVDYNMWPDLSKAILFILMLIGGCEGGTAGGFKVSRILIIFATIKNELKKALHPRAVYTARVSGNVASQEIISSTLSYLAIYIISFILIFVLISAEPLGFETNFSATLACFNNIGPGLGLVGPAGSFAVYSSYGKFILAMSMLLGRLEIYPLLLGIRSLTNSN